jgi:O-antigen/teichoic acid export membrane protein
VNTRSCSSFPHVGGASSEVLTRLLACFDQAIVSGSSFLLLILVARFSDPAQLGFYSLATSMVVILLAVQESILSRPYTIYLHRPLISPCEETSTYFILGIGFALFTAALVGLAALVLSFVPQQASLPSVLAGLSAAVAFITFRDLVRRYAFTQFQFARVCILDATVAAVALLLLSGTTVLGYLSAASGLLALGAGCAAALTILYTRKIRQAVRLDPKNIRAVLVRNWNVGKWLLAGHACLQAQGFLILSLAIAVSGAAAAGIYTALQSVIGLINPFLFGIFNVLLPQYARVLQVGELRALQRRALLDAVVLSAGLSGLCILLYAYGGAIIGSAGVPASIGLQAMERTRTAAYLMAITTFITVSLVALLLPVAGLLGAALGILIAETAGACLRWGAFLFALRTFHSQGPSRLKAVAA